MDKYSYKTIAKPVEAKLTEKNSRFLAFVSSVDSEDDIRLFLNQLKEAHPKATHHCYAWRLGTTGNLYRANDDGEPSGSAGRPILGQIDSFELTNVVIDVVRYYGGVKLGVSGLIKAYKGAARMALEQAVIVTKQVKAILIIKVPYQKVNDFQSWVNHQPVLIKKEEYSNTHGNFTLECNQSDIEHLKRESTEFE